MNAITTAAAIDIVGKHTEAMLSELRKLIVEGGRAPDPHERFVWNRGDVGFLSPAEAAEVLGRPVEVPGEQASWTEVQRLTGQTYQWPENNGGLEKYDPFVVYESAGLVLAVAPLVNNREREQTWVFKMSTDLEKKRPVTPFIAADDFAESGEMVALIRGKGPTGRQMFGPGDQLPPAYEDMKIELCADRKNGGYKKSCVVAHKDDAETMLRHCAAQVKIRGL